MSPMLLTPFLSAQSDARLIELARAGHERAFEALVRRYRGELLAHCRRILRGDAAEDALQQGLLGAWSSLQNGSEVREVRAWLHRIVHNAALRSASGDTGHAELADVEVGTDGPEAELIRRQDLDETLSALASLPELQREALVQTTVEGHSYDTVARMLGLSQTSLRGLVYRARATLRASATAITPVPLLNWLLARTRHPSAVNAAAQAGSAGAPAAVGGLLVKGGAVVLAVSAAAGGAGVAHLVAASRHHHRVADAAPRVLNAGLKAAGGTTSPRAAGDPVRVAIAAAPVTNLAHHRAKPTAGKPKRSPSRDVSHSGSPGSDARQRQGSPGGPGPSSGSGDHGSSGSGGSSGSSGSSDGSGQRTSGGDGGQQASSATVTTTDGSGSGGGQDSGGGQTTSGGGQTSTDGSGGSSNTSTSSSGGGDSSGGRQTTSTDTTTTSGGGSGSGGG